MPSLTAQSVKDINWTGSSRRGIADLLGRRKLRGLQFAENATCDDLAAQIRRRLALRQRGKPLGVFLFAGAPPAPAKPIWAKYWRVRWSAEAQSSCPLRPGPLSAAGAGKVVGFMPPEQALELTHRTEAERQAKLNPAYINNARVFVRPDGSPMRFVVIVQATMTVKIGDQVEFGSAFRDSSLPCHYLPPLISQIAGR